MSPSLTVRNARRRHLYHAVQSCSLSLTDMIRRCARQVSPHGFTRQPPDDALDTLLMSFPIPHPGVVARALPDGSVLFHPSTEVYFGLNETGTLIWNALTQGAASEDALTAAVLARWPEASAADVLCHVRELLADLSVEELVVDAVASVR